MTALITRKKTVSEPEPVQLRRSERERRPPDHYEEWASVATKEPTNVTEAMSCSDKREWTQAMNDEMESLRANQVWDSVELPKD